MDPSKRPVNFHPLLFDSRTGEPYLQLPPPNDNVRITPPRREDVEVTVQLLNDERVYTWLVGLPHPYSQEDGIAWNSMITSRYQGLFQRIETGERIVDACPVQCIREVHADGTDTFIGDISIRRESTQMEWASSENETKAVGDPTIVWTIGCERFNLLATTNMILIESQVYLAVSHHRRGIMSAAVRMLIDNWAVPRMNCQRIITSAMLGNVASVGVFKKLGFKHVRDVENAIRLPEGRGGHLKSLHLMEWTYNGD